MKKIYMAPGQRVIELGMEQLCATSGSLEDNGSALSVSLDNEEEFDGAFGARTNSVWDEEW